MNVAIARKNGAVVGECVTLPRQLARIANSNLKIGNNTSIQSSKFDLRAPIHIGSNVIIGSDIEIITLSHNIDSKNWEHKAYGIEIADYVWLATRCFILPSCRKIQRGAVIAAGAIVVSDVDEMTVMSGNPAVFIKKRKEVHEDLCVEGLLGNDLKTYMRARKNKNVG
jgi:acetyltransferase-like isoleucine patch superfamily enzyme